MNHLVSNLLIYGSMPQNTILMQLSEICRKAQQDDADLDALRTAAYHEVKRILAVATDYGFDKNLWHNYLTYVLITSENPFTLVCEKTGAQDGSVNEFAKSDFRVFRALFDYDFTWLENKLDLTCFSQLCHYRAIVKTELMYNRNVSEKVRALSEKLEQTQNEEEFFRAVTGFYSDFGVGMFGLNKAFRLLESGAALDFQPINNMEVVHLDDLVGYEEQKKKLVDNTLAFLQGKKANNVLLYGDSGTGKSSSIKAIVNEFYPQGLRMIEIYKHQFQDLSGVIAKVKNRNYRFIIYMDDLSFEEFEIEYKFLKAVIEGGVETKPENILIYATSNRRHLIKETWNDRNDMTEENGIHRSDSVEEKMSLFNRFGLAICYSKPSREEYHAIVRELARKNGITMPDEELIFEANKWEIRGGAGASGRAAQQFINYLCTQR